MDDEPPAAESHTALRFPRFGHHGERLALLKGVVAVLGGRLDPVPDLDFHIGRLLGAADVVEAHPAQVDPVALARLLRDVAAALEELKARP